MHCSEQIDASFMLRSFCVWFFLGGIFFSFLFSFFCRRSLFFRSSPTLSLRGRGKDGLGGGKEGEEAWNVGDWFQRSCPRLPVRRMEYCDGLPADFAPTPATFKMRRKRKNGGENPMSCYPSPIGDRLSDPPYPLRGTPACLSAFAGITSESRLLDTLPLTSLMRLADPGV
ncbi:hypothetical protein HOY80DRAFT_81427 [Tuber brumale]|nr:hypothetical protein HOY80DRAFT_81427 [Tuber brumale]